MKANDKFGPFGIAMLLIAAACIPVTKVALMFWEYRLLFPLAKPVGNAALIIALILACLFASFAATSLKGKLALGTTIIVWSVFAYLAVVAGPGCLWAPACP